MRGFERLEGRLCMAGLDTNGDGEVTPNDALQVINLINAEAPYEERLDVNGDGHVSPIDVLIIVNDLNERGYVPPNDPPEGAGEVLVLDEDTEATIDLLANDRDPEGFELSVSVISGPEYGEIELNQGVLTYIPAENYYGSDEIRYEVTDIGGLSAEFVVSITVNNVIEPAARTFTVLVDAAPLGAVVSHSSTPQVTAEGMIEAVRQGLNEYTKVADLDFRIVTSGSHDWKVETAVVMAGGLHYRGQANSYRVQLHSGFVPGGTHSCRDAPCHVSFVSDAFWRGGIPQVKKILIHEMGHTSLMSWGHSSSTDCVMHSNASANDFCQAEKDSLVARYGPSKEPGGRL